MKDPVKKCRKALNFIKAKKAAGPSGIKSKLLKVCKNIGVKKLVEVANILFQVKEMSEKD